MRVQRLTESSSVFYDVGTKAQSHFAILQSTFERTAVVVDLLSARCKEK